MVQAELLVTVLSVCVHLCLCDFLGDLHKLGAMATLEQMIGSLDVSGDAVEAVIDRATDAVAHLIGGQCTYTCTNGRKPIPSKTYKATTNGCGSYGIQLESANVPAMTTCCDEHDICYDTCNAARAGCDRRFRTCLHAICSNIQGSLTKTKFLGCLDTADLMYTGTLALGCSPYLTAQAAACSCGTHTSRQSQYPTDRKSNIYDSEDSRANDLPKSRYKVQGHDVQNLNPPRRSNGNSPYAEDEENLVKSTPKYKDKHASQRATEIRQPTRAKPRDEL